MLWISLQQPASTYKVLFGSTVLHHLQVVKQQLILLRSQSSQIAHLRTGPHPFSMQVSLIKWNSCCQQQLKMNDEDVKQCGLPLCPASVLKGKEREMRTVLKSAEISNACLN